VACEATLAAGLIGAGIADRCQCLRVQPRAVLGKAAEDNLGHRRRHGQRSHGSTDRNPCGAVGRETINAGGDGGIGNRGKAVRMAELDGAAIARRQRVILAPAAAMPDRADGMNHVPRRQPIRQSDFGIAGGAAMKRTAFGKKLGSGRAMDRAIDAPAAEQ
jgi:hypothetical protein